MIAHDWLVVIFLISEIDLFFVFSQISFMTNVVNIFVVFNLFLLKVCEVHGVKMVSNDGIVIKLFYTERGELFFDEFIKIGVNDLRVRVGMRSEFFTGSVFSILMMGVFIFLG